MPRRKPASSRGPDRHRPRPTSAEPRNQGGAADDPGLLFGRHAVEAALANERRRVVAIRHTPEAAEALAAAIQRLPPQRRAALPVPQVADRSELESLLPAATVHQGVVLRVEPLPDRALDELIAAWGGRSDVLVLILDQVTDPQNVGAVLRSAAAFGAAAIVLQDRHGPPVTGALAKIASGALEIVPLVRVVNLARAMEELKAAGFWCTGLAEEGAVELAQVDLSGRCALALGAEGSGLRRLTRETCDALARLPTLPPIGSLNIAAAAAVALYQARLARSGRNELV